MTAFGKVFASAMEAFDEMFGDEVFALSPRAAPPGSGGRPDVNARRVADGSRPAFTFQGAFMSVAAPGHLEGRRLPTNMTRTAIAPGPVIDAPRSAFEHLPREGDLVTRQATGEVFEVGKEITDADGRTVLHLIERQTRAG